MFLRQRRSGGDIAFWDLPSLSHDMKAVTKEQSIANLAEKKNRKTLVGFEPGAPRLKVQCSITEPKSSCQRLDINL